MPNDFYQAILVLFVMLGLIYLIYKKGFLKVNPFSIVGGWHKRGPRHFKARYTTLKGADAHRFKFPKNKKLTFSYHIQVEEGSLRLSVNSNKYALFEKTFKENQQGSVEITPTTRTHLLILDGKRFKGRCECEFK